MLPPDDDRLTSLAVTDFFCDPLSATAMTTPTMITAATIIVHRQNDSSSPFFCALTDPPSGRARRTSLIRNAVSCTSAMPVRRPVLLQSLARITVRRDPLPAIRSLSQGHPSTTFAMADRVRILVPGQAASVRRTLPFLTP